MRKLAKKLLDDEKVKQEQYLAYLKGMMYYNKKNYVRAVKEFIKSESHEASYMGAMANFKLGMREDGLRALWDYQNKVEDWIEGVEKEKALARVKKLKGFLEANIFK